MPARRDVDDLCGGVSVERWERPALQQVGIDRVEVPGHLLDDVLPGPPQPGPGQPGGQGEDDQHQEPGQHHPADPARLDQQADDHQRDGDDEPQHVDQRGPLPQLPRPSRLEPRPDGAATDRSRRQRRFPRLPRTINVQGMSSQTGQKCGQFPTVRDADDEPDDHVDHHDAGEATGRLAQRRLLLVVLLPLGELTGGGSGLAVLHHRGGLVGPDRRQVSHQRFQLAGRLSTAYSWSSRELNSGWSSRPSAKASLSRPAILSRSASVKRWCGWY